MPRRSLRSSPNRPALEFQKEAWKHQKRVRGSGKGVVVRIRGVLYATACNQKQRVGYAVEGGCCTEGLQVCATYGRPRYRSVPHLYLGMRQRFFYSSFSCFYLTFVFCVLRRWQTRRSRRRYRRRRGGSPTPISDVPPKFTSPTAAATAAAARLGAALPFERQPTAPPPEFALLRPLLVFLVVLTVTAILVVVRHPRSGGGFPLLALRYLLARQLAGPANAWSRGVQRDANEWSGADAVGTVV